MINTGASKLRPTLTRFDAVAGQGFVAPVEAVLGKGNANGFYFDGANDDLGIADSAAQAIGTSDFAVFVCLAANDWTPSATECLFSKISGNDGVKLNLTTAGLLQLQIGNGTNFTTYSYSSTSPVPTLDNHVAWVGVTVDRDGVATFYWNGSQLGDTVDVSGSSAQTATGAGTAYLMRDGSNYHRGRVYGFWLLNYCPDAATCLRYYTMGVPYSDMWGSFAALYSSDFSAGVNGWAGQRSTITGNIDGIGGQDDTLRIDTDTTTGTHGAYYSLTNGKKYRASASLYVASGNVTTTGAGLAISGPTIQSNWITTPDSWQTATTPVFTATNTAISLLVIVGRKTDGTYASYAGAPGDLIYAKSVSLTQVGCVICLDGSADGTVNHYQWQDSSTNLLDFTVTGAAMLIPRARGRIRAVTNTNGNQQMLGGTALPASNVIVKDVYMVAASGTPTVSVGSASAGTQYVNGQSLSTSLSRPTQATPLFAPTANLWVNSNGTMNVTTVVYYELPLV